MSETDGARPLDLHVDFYPRDAIDAAVGAFSRFGPIAVEVRAPYHRVLLPSGPAASGEVLAREFANYVLAVAALGRAPARGDAA